MKYKLYEINKSHRKFCLVSDAKYCDKFYYFDLLANISEPIDYLSEGKKYILNSNIHSVLEIKTPDGVEISYDYIKENYPELLI